MKRTSIRRVILPGIAALTLAVSGCSAGNDSGGTSSDLSGTLAGGGSSAQQAAQEAWAVGFQTANSGVTVEYDPIGSGGGRENFISGAFPFAGSDAALSTDGELADAKTRCGGTDAIEIPDYVSPIAIIFNVDGVDSLQLSPDTLAGIFGGKITKWNDPAIAADNPDATLPSATINPVHRSDESGTTENFTDYLTAVSAKAWGGDVVQSWPAGFGGEGAKGTSGVVSAVQNGQNAIGYADASQAGDLGVATIKVGDAYVAPSSEAAGKILDVSPRAQGRAAVDMAFELDHTTQEAGTYPIVLTSYLLACQTYDDQATADLVKGYLTYILSDEGQKQAADEAGSSPLSPALQQEAQGIVEKISKK